MSETSRSRAHQTQQEAAASETPRSRAHQTQQESSLLWRLPVRRRTKHTEKAAAQRRPVRGRTQHNEKAAVPGRCLGRIVLLPKHLAVGRLLLYCLLPWCARVGHPRQAASILSVTLVRPRRSPPAGCFCIVCYLCAPASVTPGRLLLSYLSTLCARGRKPGREAY